MDGYNRLAAVIGADRDLAIVRRFSTLNSKNLLYMQGELTLLEADLRTIAKEDKESKDLEKAEFEFCIQTLKGPHMCEDGDQQWRKILEIRQKLKEYNKALLRFRKVCALEEANKADLKTLREWLERKRGGHFFLKGYEADIWNEDHEKDLVSVTAGSRNRDTLSHWVDLYILPFYHRALGHRVKDPIAVLEESYSDSALDLTSIYHYHDSTIRAIINILSTTLSSLLPTMSIFILYFVRSPLARLGSIVAFTGLFSAVLGVIGMASRVESFAATTAFAAVQVVFVGGTNMTSA